MRRHQDVLLSPTQQTHAVAAACATASSIDATRGSDAFETLVPQLHMAVGRLQSHVNELQAYRRYHARLLAKLAMRQRSSPDDTVAPASVVQLLAQPRAALERHLQLLTQRCDLTCPYDAQRRSQSHSRALVSAGSR